MKWIKSKKTGVRYREHPTRTHGVVKDRYYTIFYKMDGKTITEALGWASEGGWTEKMASEERGELLKNRRLGEGPRTLREKRALNDTDRQEKVEEAAKTVKNKLTFRSLYNDSYLPASKACKAPRSWGVEECLFKWIDPVIGDKPLKDVAPIHLEKIKVDMAKAGRAPRYIHYALAVVRQVFNYALTHDIYDGVNPVSKVRLPGGDNRRLRFLTREEAAILLEELATKSHNVHNIALVSLHTGMRAGEVFGLAWADVDVDRGILTLRDTKNGRTRAAFMTEAVKEMFRAKERGAPSDLVFPDRNGKRMERISNTFARAVDTIKLNEGIMDRRQQVTFHTLRHTYASWHVENGTDLYAVKELLGHSDFKMTARYSHLGENTLQAAVKRLDSTLQAPVKPVVLIKKG